MTVRKNKARAGSCPSSKQLVMACLAQAALVSAAAFNMPVKRDTVSNFLTLVAGPFQNSLPTTTANASALANKLLGPLTHTPYTVPSRRSPKDRAAAIAKVRETFTYGPAMGGGPYYPAGEVGVAKIVQDDSYITQELTSELLLSYSDGVAAENNSARYNDLKTLDGYQLIYKDQWTNVMPKGHYPGVETNYTQDLFFSMQRLTHGPFSVRRLRYYDTLEFEVDDATARAVSGMTLKQLLDTGRLFYADHRDQAKLNTTSLYHAACDAYFYISPANGDFLPLAIRTNTNTNTNTTSLVYTPADSPNDWLLAKIAFNVNDFWFTQWNHLAATHEVVQIIYMAAIRTLSHQHPIFGVFSRVAYEAFSVQPLAEYALFLDGALVDLVFPFTGSAARKYSSDLYNYGGAGRFQANFFERDFAHRGLISRCKNVPNLKHVPFYEDAQRISAVVRTFMTTFIKSYYPSDRAVVADHELQAWVAECNGPAKVIDFPHSITTRQALIDVLVQLVYLATSAHHAVNTNALIEISTVLPFSPLALHAPLPSKKSTATDVASYLPPLNKAIEQVLVGALFARPLLANSTRSMIHMFDNQTMLNLMTEQTREANKVFMKSLEAISAEISGRTFDKDGLSQGAPFIWTALDPNVAPYSLTI